MEGRTEKVVEIRWTGKEAVMKLNDKRWDGRKGKRRGGRDSRTALEERGA